MICLTPDQRVERPVKKLYRALHTNMADEYRILQKLIWVWDCMPFFVWTLDQDTSLKASRFSTLTGRAISYPAWSDCTKQQWIDLYWYKESHADNYLSSYPAWTAFKHVLYKVDSDRIRTILVLRSL